MLKPKRRFQAVVSELVDGLRRGVIQLREEPPPCHDKEPISPLIGTDRDAPDERQLYQRALSRLLGFPVEVTHLFKQPLAVSLEVDLNPDDAAALLKNGLSRRSGPLPFPWHRVSVTTLRQAGRLLLSLALLPVFAILSPLFLWRWLWGSSRSFKTPEDIRLSLQLPVVACIPVLGTPEKTAATAEGEPLLDPHLAVYHWPKSPEAEAFRAVRTAVSFWGWGRGQNVIQVTSPTPMDGKSTIAANLAITMAQSGKTVILVDADLRTPSLHRLFHLSDQVGLTSVLADNADLAHAVVPTAIPNLVLLPSGPVPTNPGELLSSTRFSELLASLREQYDFVLIDTPPLLNVSDPSVVASSVDGVLLVIRLGSANRPAAERAKDVLQALGTDIVGIVVNGIRDSGTITYGYGYEGHPHEHREVPGPRATHEVKDANPSGIRGTQASPTSGPISD